MFELVLFTMVVLYGFIAISISEFGLLRSYSAYASKWAEKRPNRNMEVWSFFTVIVAFLMFPAMLNAGDGNPAQFLGMFVPMYLVAVGLTPHYETDEKQRRIHTFCAILCAALAAIWIVFISGHLNVILWSLAAAFLAMMLTKSYRSIILWLEIVMFASAQISILMQYAP